MTLQKTMKFQNILAYSEFVGFITCITNNFKWYSPNKEFWIAQYLIMAQSQLFTEYERPIYEIRMVDFYLKVENIGSEENFATVFEYTCSVMEDKVKEIIDGSLEDEENFRDVCQKYRKRFNKISAEYNKVYSS